MGISPCFHEMQRNWEKCSVPWLTFPTQGFFSCNYQKMQFTPSFSFCSLDSCAIEKSTAQASHSVSLIFQLSIPICLAVEWTLTSCFDTSFGSISRILFFSFLARRFKIDIGILLASLQQQWALQQKQRRRYNHRNKPELCARLSSTSLLLPAWLFKNI